MTKYIDEYGDNHFTFADELGLRFVIGCNDWHEAYDIAIDNLPALSDDEDIIRAYGFYIMQACDWKDKDSDADFFILSDHDDHGIIISADVLHCVGNRRTIGMFLHKKHAIEYCLEYIAINEIELTDGYQYQSNATDSGIVEVSFNTDIRASTLQEIELWQTKCGYLTETVKAEIKQFISELEIVTPNSVLADDERCQHCDSGNDCENSCNTMELTIATDDGNQWNYQTGDNSYSGGCYGLKHWAYICITADDKRDDIYTDAIEQLGDDLHNAVNYPNE